MPVLWPLVRTRMLQSATPMVAAYGPALGGLIQNPSSPEDQGITSIETLYVDLVSPPGLVATRTTFAVEPGQTFALPAFGGPVWVNAATIGHQFTGYVVQPSSDFQESKTDFPPNGPTTLLHTIPSYLYQQYSDDDDLQAFVTAYNIMAEQYVDWFVHINLPVYTKDPVSGPLLDWVAAGLYGILRPALPSGLQRVVGPLNTYQFNAWPLNRIHLVSSGELFTTTDDLFRRIISWHFFKGDGKYFDIRWLKRRVMRFLEGVDGYLTEDQGGTLGPDETYPVSVTFGANNEVNINLFKTRRFFTGGALIGAFGMNTRMFNEFDTRSVEYPVSPLAPILKSAIDTGVLELPFQYKFIVNVKT